jgi:hypothetical protein
MIWSRLKGGEMMGTMNARLLGIVVAVTAAVIAADASAVEVGIGCSNAKDAKTAGAEAAEAAREALGEADVKLVLVYHDSELFDTSTSLLEGVNAVFDASLVYGCSGYAPLSHLGGDSGVAVLALGDDIQVATAVAKTAGKQDDLDCGKRIGQTLKGAGLASVLGSDVRVIGGAAFRGRGYAAGATVEGSNIGILISGDFTCDVSLQQDNSPDGLVASARRAFEEAIGEDEGKVKLVFAFDCGGRRASMLKLGNFPAGLQAMKEAAGDTPFFGFFGSGEIGCKSANSTPCGVGHHIATCAIKAR